MQQGLPKLQITLLVILLFLAAGIAHLTEFSVYPTPQPPTTVPFRKTVIENFDNLTLMPPVLTSAINQLTTTNEHFILSTDPTFIDVTLNTLNEGTAIYNYTLVPVTSFSSLRDDILLTDLQKTPSTYCLINTENIVKNLLGTTSAPIPFAKIADLVDELPKDAIALVPFDSLTPKLKVLTLDGKSILDKKAESWPLTITVSATGKDGEIKKLTTALSELLPTTNRDTTLMSTLVMTGVTAISRGVEYEIVRHKDLIFPARGVMDVLSQADLTHVDNENPLFEGCVPENEGIILCGRAASIAALKAIGTDIVDLTGNHMNDYGPKKALESIAAFENAGFSYFGGGKDIVDASKVLYKEVNGTKLAFVGYGYFDSLNGPTYRSLAQEDYPGANFYSEEKLTRDITEARKNANFVIVDYQFIENYSYEPIPGQVEVFQKTIDLGADLVVGVQSHQPQWVRFYSRDDGSNGLIFYGLGNFFFDQMWSLGTRQAIIPRFNFYDGELISVEIMTTLLYEYAQPRFVTGTDRIAILTEILPR